MRTNVWSSLNRINKSAATFNAMGLGYDTSFSMKFPSEVIRMNSLGILMGHKYYGTKDPIDAVLSQYKRLNESMKSRKRDYSKSDLDQMLLCFILGALSTSVLPKDFADLDEMRQLVISRKDEINMLLQA